MRRPPVSAVGVLATATVVFVVAVVLVVVLKVRSADDDGSPGPDAAGGTADAGGTSGSTGPAATLADLAGTDLVVGRDAFCDDVDEAAVTAALATGPDGGAEDVSVDVTAESYDNGDLLPTGAAAGATAGTEAVAHEFGCSWTGADGAVARAWVFAPPVSPARAKRLAAAATRADGCAPLPEGASGPFGDPGAAYTCTDPAGVVTVGHVGLFGDAWLSCSVTAAGSAAGATATATGTATAAEDEQGRADRWCAAAALAAHN